jgi:DNA-binding transcriptional regulator YdaS (Cro superfamily)
MSPKELLAFCGKQCFQLEMDDSPMASPSISPDDVARAALDDAIKAAGGPVALSRALTRDLDSISSQAISQWRRVPAERVIDVERATGVPKERLRPDIYPVGETVRL